MAEKPETVDLSGKKIFIVCPTYDGKIPVEWMFSFNETVKLCSAYGVDVGIQFRMGSSLIPKCRDELVHNFLFDTDHNYILMIDADIVWNPVDVLHLLSKVDKHHVVAGMYCTKEDEPRFFTDWITIGGEPCISDGLIRSKGVPAGFLMTSREVLEGMRDTYKDLNYPVGKQAVGVNTEYDICAMFTPIISNGAYKGEDISFCKRLIDAGYRLWIDPEIELIHIGNKKYSYSYKQYLEDKAKEAE